MLSLISTLGGLLISGLPKMLGYFQDRADKKHELELARMQTERELQLAAAGFAAQARIEEIRTDQIEMQTEAQRVTAALDHDKQVLEKASKWVANYVGTVRPTVTYILILELCLINVWMGYKVFAMPGLITDMDTLRIAAELIFSDEEMAMLSGLLGYWFGARTWDKKK
jgi:hypothetical protein